MKYLMMIFSFSLGLFMIIKPDWIWKIENFLDVKGGEPTEFYLVTMRLGGIVVCLITFFVVLYFVLEKMFG